MITLQTVGCPECDAPAEILDRFVLESGLSQKAMAEQLGRTVQSVNLRAWRLRSSSHDLG